jgi:hypothetical protein
MRNLFIADLSRGGAAAPFRQIAVPAFKRAKRLV